MTTAQREERIIHMMALTERLNQWVLKIQIQKIQMQSKRAGQPAKGSE